MKDEAKKEEAKPVFLRGKKVILRPRHIDDVPRLARWINDPDVRKNIMTQFPLAEHDERAWVERKSDDKEVLLSIDTIEGRHIGTMGLHRINWIDRTAVSGALIGEKDCWRKGYGTDAKMTLLAYAFLTLGLRKICSEAIEYNAGSLGFNAKCGYKQEGIRKKQIFREGKCWDVVLTAVFAEDWLPLWEEYKKGLK